jgi:UV DNA damage endonuclease
MRLGFACKYMHPDQKQKKKLLEDLQRPYNCKATTVAWLNRQTKQVAEQRLWDIMVHNIDSFKKLVEYVGSLEPQFRMVRLGSDVLPVYTEPTWSYYWKRQDVRDYCEREFAKVGELARTHDVRLSMHPGQFTVLASDNPDIVNRSIEEFEYHIAMVNSFKILNAMYTYLVSKVHKVLLTCYQDSHQKQETVLQLRMMK